jgi:PAS domain-containing protein
MDQIDHAQNYEDTIEALRRAEQKYRSIFENATEGIFQTTPAGSADDDPSGIATYSSVGAQFGYAMLWTMPLIYPFMAAIQESAPGWDASPGGESPATRI